jgi:hypothetical protein
MESKLSSLEQRIDSLLEYFEGREGAANGSLERRKGTGDEAEGKSKPS